MSPGVKYNPLKSTQLNWKTKLSFEIAEVHLEGDGRLSRSSSSSHSCLLLRLALQARCHCCSLYSLRHVLTASQDFLELNRVASA